VVVLTNFCLESRGPGAGKGTQCAKLVAECGFIHLSAGDLLRAEITSGSEHGEMIEKIIKDGAIVPVAVTCGLIKAAMERQGWATKKFLVDGFPRNEDNYIGWNEVMGDTIELAGVLHFVVTED
jgi:UMP-CMP kinase